MILTGKKGFGVWCDGQVLIEGISHQAAIAYARDYNELEKAKKSSTAVTSSDTSS